MSTCSLCDKELSPSEVDDPDLVYREVKSWVHGPKLQGPVLREQTGRLAHRVCIFKLINGQSVDQEQLPGLDAPLHDHTCTPECMASEEHMRAMEEDAHRQVAELESGGKPDWVHEKDEGPEGPPISMWSPAPWESMY